MSYFYPKCVMALRVVLEDHNFKSDVRLQKVYELNVRPKRATVNINDYTRADEFECEIDYKQFPFDPRTIRALGVQVHMEDTPEVLAINRENAVFMGFADLHSVELDENTRMVKFEGRDFTALLLDAEYPRLTPINLGESLDTLIKRIVGELKATVKLKVVNRTGAALPVIGKFAPDFGGGMSAQKNVKKGETYWEIIQDLASRAGLIAYIELDQLIISKPRAVYSDTQAIQFIYGRNLKNLKFQRKIGRQKSLNIRVLSYDPISKSVIEALVPEQADEEWCKKIGVKKQRLQVTKLDAQGGQIQEDAPFIGFRLPNIKDQPHLVQVAQEIFEEIGRQQLEGSLETKEMLVIQQVAGKTDSSATKSFDILKIRNGTPVAIDIEQVDMEQMDRTKQVSERTQYLVSRGYDPAIAEAIAIAYGKMGNFYTKAVQFTIDDDGFQMSLDFINLIQLPPRLLT